jgi:hypothetical protein
MVCRKNGPRALAGQWVQRRWSIDEPRCGSGLCLLSVTDLTAETYQELRISVRKQAENRLTKTVDDENARPATSVVEIFVTDTAVEPGMVNN